MQLSGPQLQFLARLAVSPDGRELIEIMSGKLADVEVKLRTASGEEVFRQQGRAQQLDELLDDLLKANEKLNRSVPNRPRFPAGAHT